MADRLGPSYLVLNRYDDEFGEYHRFVDPDRCRLFYLTVPDGLGVLDTESAWETVVVDDLEYETVLPVAQRLVRQYGEFDGIVGLSEYDLVTAARLRDALGVPGWSEDFVLGFRDKVRMKHLVESAGLPVPRYTDLAGPAVTADHVVSEVGLPVILKPRAGAASNGVLRIDDKESLEHALQSVERGAYECEEYVAGEIYHVDGVRRGGGFHFVSASVYVNTCLEFAQGLPLGSVLLDPGPRRDETVAFAAACLDALALDDGPFHLELMRRPSGELVFLEVGLRPGGAEVAFIHRDLYGIDLMGEAFRATLGLPPLTAAEEFPRHRAGGWALMPEPRPLPSRVVGCRPVREEIPEVYEEIVPAVGEVFDGTGGYGHVGGRFRLRGADERAVRAAVLRIMDRYHLDAEPVAARTERITT
ncbi:ATP-grasp domain-containing protein [Streptomyces eurythermus]|uniref:ATP-grasp domain-containing protein n=1 Tax=Streptomyces eurythermus TaxID=42237 RepID=UPI0036FEAB68